MGVVRKESAKGMLFSYFGTALGFVNQTFILTYLLPPALIGLMKVIQAFANILSRIGAFNVNGITVRFFPQFRDKDKGHNGFLSLSLIYSLVGFTLAAILAIALKGLYIDSYVERAPLFYEYFYLSFPLAFALLFLSTFNSYISSLYKIGAPTFFKEIVLRILVIGIVVLYYYKLVSLTQFLILFVGLYLITTLFSFFYIMYLGEFSFKPSYNILTKNLISKIKEFAIWTYLAGIVRVFIFEIDKLMLAGMVGLYQTGIYSIVIIIGNLIDIPMLNMVKISNPVISQAYKENDMEKVKEVYYKTSLTLLIAGSLLFLLIWTNAEHILALMKPEYADGLNVILIIGIAKLFNMLGGNSGGVIQMSKYFKFNLVANLAGVAMAVVLNLILIPKYGMMGAAIATMVSIASFSFAKIIFIYIRFKMNPFNYRSYIVIGLLLLTLLVVSFVPDIAIENLSRIIVAFLNIIVKTIVVLAIFVTSVLLLKLSPDINEFVIQILKRMRVLK